MRIGAALRKAGEAARANLLPGLLLQALMLVFLALYFLHDGTRQFLSAVSNLKQQTGFAFAFVTYVISAALLPELLRVVFFQRGNVTRRNAWNFLTAAPFWGCMGVVVDVFYRAQAVWFGAGSGFWVIAPKVMIDQLLFSPLYSAPFTVAYFYWRDGDFRPAVLGEIFTAGFWWNKIFPVVVAGWCVWIPGVSLVYFMPTALQLPVAVLIQTFWVLILTTVSERKSAMSPGGPAPSAALDNGGGNS